MKIVELAKKYDFWLRGDCVTDLARSLDGKADVLVFDCRVAPLSGNGYIDPADIKEVAGCSDCLVFLDFIGYRVHFSWNASGTTSGVFCLPNGVTAACNARSVGINTSGNFVHFRILPAITTLQALADVTIGGMAGAGYMENIDPALHDERAMIYLFSRYRPHPYGFKPRIGKDISEDMGLRPLKESMKLARKHRTRLSLHATYPLRPMPEIVNYLGWGDVLCHAFQAKGFYNILDESGRILPEVWSARERGVLFDSVQGRTHCSFLVVRVAIEQGFSPDVISTDLITSSVYQEQLFSLPVTMSRSLALNMFLYDMIRYVITVPVSLIGLDEETDTLHPGALADIAVMKLEERKFDFQDSYDNSLPTSVLLLPQIILKAGRRRWRSTAFTALCC